MLFRAAAVLALMAVGLAADAAGFKLVDPPKGPVYRAWPSTPPKGCPFAQSKEFAGVAFTGVHAEYTGADTWLPSWASDGNLYSPWADGNVNGVSIFAGGPGAATGYARIVGDDPLNLQVVESGTCKADPGPYGGRYPAANLVYNGVWYYGTHCELDGGRRLNWDILGPFVGSRWSTDYGKTWNDTPHTPEKPIFGEPGRVGGKVKFGTPFYLDFGKNMEHSPDGKAYLVGHGALATAPHPRFAHLSWCTADGVYLARVTPSIKNINDATKYEFFAGRDSADRDLWSQGLADAKPIAEWPNNMGYVTMTYDAPLAKYIMCVTDGGNTISKFNTYIMESDRATGPWKLITYMRDFGEQAYCVNVPSKFIAPDGRSMWLMYSANFMGSYRGNRLKSKPAGSSYAMCLQKIRLLTPEEVAASANRTEVNVAPEAMITVSSTHQYFRPTGMVDGVVDPGCGIGAEWATDGEYNTATARLTWNEPQLVDRVRLYDLPNLIDQVTGATLVLSTGLSIPIGELPNDAKKGVEIGFPACKIDWLMVVITKARTSTRNIGLSEIEALRARH